MGRLSNPTQRRLSPSDIDGLITAYAAGATINQIAADHGIRRTTVAAHLDRHHIPRHSERTAWGNNELRTATEQYVTGMSLAHLAAEYGLDAHTIANRFRRAGIPVRSRRGWRSHHTAR